VLRQTFRDFELLVIGDGCTDDSEAVVRSIGDPRVRWINLPENTRHQSGPNNEGLRQAQGEVIAYLGHDDLWLPHHLASHVEALDSTAGDLASSSCLIVPPDPAPIWPSIPRPERGFFAPPVCVTHRRRVTDDLGGWVNYRDVDEARDISPDIELWRRIQKAGRKMTFVPRLTGIKFPASMRRNVYRERPCAEQARWTARIEQEPELEPRVLIECIASGAMPSRMPYRELVRYFVTQTITRVWRRITPRRSGSMKPRQGNIDRIRRFKGLS
jgi:glycosyltransferase involved in cell wall biosynthesis